jgi:hypothetical protein
VKHNKSPRYKSTQLYPLIFETYLGKKIASSTNLAGKTGYLPEEN